MTSASRNTTKTRVAGAFMFRRLLNAVIVAISLFLAGWIVIAQENKSDSKDLTFGYFMYGEDHVFAIRVPNDWIVDAATGKSLGLHAVIYPKGSSWREAPVTMYTNFNRKDKKADTIEKIIANDIDGYKKDSPNLHIDDRSSLPIAKGTERVIVKYFSGGSGNNFEAVAYIDESKGVAMIVLSARTESDFKKTLPVFEKIVGSYFFVGDNVTIDK